jgi:hypothetical protein
MNTIPFISTNTRLFDRLCTIIRISNRHDQYDLMHLTNTRAAEDFLTTEMPELIFINFSDAKIDSLQFLETILHDPWLLHGGVIAICKDYQGDQYPRFTHVQRSGETASEHSRHHSRQPAHSFSARDRAGYRGCALRIIPDTQQCFRGELLHQPYLQFPV